MVKIFNIDWFQFSGYLLVEEFKAIKKVGNFELVELKYGTRHFKTITEVFDGRQNKKIATIAYSPHLEGIQKNLCIIKIDNWLLYQNYIMTYVADLLDALKITFNNLSRVDVCCDFNHFDYRKLYPAKFIQSFLSGKYVKLRRSKGQAYFEQGEKLDFQYIKFGTGKSRICSYIYNKSKELEQVVNKPHIVETWKKNNLTGIVWRCEFKIMNFDFLLTDKETGEQITYNGNLAGLNSLDIITNAKPLFEALTDHYLHFKINGKDRNKSRLKNFKLFDLSEEIEFSKVYNDHIESSRSEKIFLKKLVDLNDQLRGTDHELGMYGEKVLEKVINATQLNTWAKYKNIKQ